MKCTICDGTGKQNIEVSEWGSDAVVEVEIDCIWCDNGEMTPEQVAEQEEYENAWCRCGNPSGQQTFVQVRHSLDVYCADCGKLQQAG